MSGWQIDNYETDTINQEKKPFHGFLTSDKTVYSVAIQPNLLKQVW